MDQNIVISTPPHVKSKRTTRGIMCDVAIALLPAAIAGIVLFGIMALVVELVAVATCVACEFAYYFIQNNGFKNAKNVCLKWWKQFDCTSVVTGLILALILPVSAKWYEVMLGSIFAIALVKMLFGGTGKNLVNPAAAGRVFMFISFSIASFAGIAVMEPVDSIVSNSILESGATVLSGYVLKGEESYLTNLDLFLGTGVLGCIGETCKVAILVGYVYLCVRKVIKWWQPLLYVAVTMLVGMLCMVGAKQDVANILPYTLSGGLLFGAVFMATDYVTSPKGNLGQIIYLVFLGLMTALLRHFTKLEVVSFVILLGNLIVPLIDRYCVRKPFGFKKEKTAKEAK